GRQDLRRRHRCGSQRFRHRRRRGRHGRRPRPRGHRRGRGDAAAARRPAGARLPARPGLQVLAGALGRRIRRLRQALARLARMNVSRRGRALMAASIVVATICALLSEVAPAPATVPGHNGRLVFASTRTGNSEIYTVYPDGTGLAQLTNNPAADSWPAWSPDGSEIAFLSSRSPAGMYVMNADGSNPHFIASGPSLEIAWSGDGSKIAYVTSVNGTPHIWTMNSDGTGQTDIVAGFFPAWSPDGTKIVFKGWAAGAGIYVMN